MLDPFEQHFQHCWGHARSLRMDYKDLRTTANTHATTPNIVGATMLGVVAPVCTQPKVKLACDLQSLSRNVIMHVLFSSAVIVLVPVH